VQGLLADYEVIHWRLVSWAILNNILLKADHLAGGVIHKRDFNVIHLISIKGAIGSAPRLRDSPLCNRNVFIGPFLYKKEVPT
jgi:hypothetical protein